MKKNNYILIIIYLCFQTAISQTLYKEPGINIITKDTVFVAGTFTKLNFYCDRNTPSLYITNSFGSTVVDATKAKDTISFEIPRNIANKRGQVNWSLILDKKIITHGVVNIISDTIVKKIETYVGPPSVQAGGKDFSMSVMIPLDTLDNPVMDNSEVIFKKQFLAKEDTTQLFIKDLLTHKKIYSTLKTGRYLISSKSYNKQSTEHTLNVWAALPNDFIISSSSNHTYADGNQICSIKTSVIKDAYGNLITDGTSVEVIIEDKNGDILTANGNTINGVATVKLVHPDHEQLWTAKAFVYGMAESNEITLSFSQVITDFDVVFTEHNREITVGPLRSFMSQMIPDGLRVELDIRKEDRTHKYMISTSKSGYVTFYLDPENYKNETYNFKITTAEISKIYKNKRVW